MLLGDGDDGLDDVVGDSRSREQLGAPAQAPPIGLVDCDAVGVAARGHRPTATASSVPVASVLAP